MTNTHHVELDVDLLGKGTIKIDGQDVSNVVSGVQMETKVGEVTQVAVVVQTPFILDGEAEVVQIVMGLSTESLDMISPSALHDKASELPWADSTELVANVLTVLKEMIQDAY